MLQDPDSCEAVLAVNAAMLRVEPDHVADPHEIGRWLSEPNMPEARDSW